jgi:hypothetical protein
MKDDLPDNELLSVYLDGELTADERAQVEYMLATNPAAGKLLADLRSLGAALKSLPRQKLDENISEKVMQTAKKRMSIQASDGEEKGQGLETGPLAEPTPVFSTVLRRLKNPRIWVWEIVVVAVAVLLIVYYPNQQADRNLVAPGNAERTIALAAKPDTKKDIAKQQITDDAQRGVALAPKSETIKDFAEKRSVDRAEDNSRSESVDQNKPSAAHEYGGMGGGAGGMGGMGGGVGRMGSGGRGASGMSSGRTFGRGAAGEHSSGGLEGVREEIKGKSDSAQKSPAPKNADLAKKGVVTSNEILSGKDAPEAMFKSGTQAFSPADKPTATVSPSVSVPTSQGQYQKSESQFGQIQGARQTESGNKRDRPLGEEKPAEQPKSPAEPSGAMLVVRFQITPEAVKNRAFEKVLSHNAIVLGEPSKEQMDAVELSDTPNKSKDAKSLFVIEPPKSRPVDIVYVEASSAQIQAAINDLSAQTGLFNKVSLTWAKEDWRFQHAIDGVDLRRGISKSVLGVQAKAAQSGEPTADQQMQLQDSYKADASWSAREALGRAVQVPFYKYIENEKAAGAGSWGDQKQSIAQSTRDRQNAPSLATDAKSQIKPSAPTAPDRLERALFVFQVVEPNSAERDFGQNAAAAGAGIPAQAKPALEVKPAEQQAK